MEDRFWLLENDDDLMFDFEVENSKDLILKQKTAIIKQILEHDGFREGSLKLYENVAVQNLKWTGIKGDKATSTEQIDLVLCKEDSVELSIKFQNDNCCNVRKPVLEGIHNLILKPLEIGSDNFERVLSLVVNYVDSIAENEIHNKYLLSTITFESAIRRKGDQKVEIPEILIREHFIREESVWDQLTEYGKEKGLIIEYKMGATGVHTEVVAKKDSNKILFDILNFSNSIPVEMEQRIPLETRIENIKMGISGDSNYAVSLVNKSANLRLSNYFREQPEQLKDLKKIVYQYCSKVKLETYMDAAYFIHSMLMDENIQEEGRRAMKILALVVVNEFKKRKENFQ